MLFLYANKWYCWYILHLFYFLIYLILNSTIPGNYCIVNKADFPGFFSLNLIVLKVIYLYIFLGLEMWSTYNFDTSDKKLLNNMHHLSCKTTTFGTKCLLKPCSIWILSKTMDYVYCIYVHILKRIKSFITTSV